MTTFEGYIFGMAAISFLGFYAAQSIKKDEVPIGRYAEKTLMYFLGFFSLIGIALLMVLEAESGGVAAQYLDFSNALFTGLLYGLSGTFFFYLLYVLIKSIDYFKNKRNKKDEDETE